MFSPYLSEFFVYDNDPVYIRNLKLEILTNIASESNITKILKELSVSVTTPLESELEMLIIDILQ